MSLRRISYDVGVLLGALRVPYMIMNVIKSITVQYLVEDFGVVISVINPGDYKVIKEKVESSFEGWRHVYISTSEEVNNKRYDIIWELMRSGYMKWLRMIYTAQFPNIIEADNLGGRIIDERLRLWDGQNKYKFLIEDNLQAKEIGFRRMLSKDPSFFDYMP
jgi:hypothetical protein